MTIALVRTVDEERDEARLANRGACRSPRGMAVAAWIWTRRATIATR